MLDRVSADKATSPALVKHRLTLSGHPGYDKKSVAVGHSEKRDYQPAKGLSMILVVHHDPDEVDHLKGHFEQAGMAALGVATVQQALNILRIEPVSAVFIDLRLPEVPCGEVIAWIREVSPRVALFGLADTPSQLEIRMCQEKGLKGYFLRPFTPGALTKAAAQIAQDAPSPQTAGPPMAVKPSRR
jgi:DNA-binding response OmpR family regulator